MAIQEKRDEREEERQPANRVIAPDIDEREEEGYDQPESSAQKMPASEPEEPE